MAKTSVQQLITDMCKRMGFDSNDATNARPDMLRQLNISQRMICQDHSLRFLVTTGTLSVVASAVAVPATIDDAKTITLGKPAGDGEIEYVQTDNWYRTRVDTFGEGTAPVEPTYYTVAQVAGTLTFLFLPANITATVPYLAQLLVTALTDAGNSFSNLPEGWEDTLLIDHAEAEFRRFMNEPQWQELLERVNDKKERLYSSYRTTKEQAMTDREQLERKTAVDKYSDEA
jgi:hypothetical protein